MGQDRAPHTPSHGTPNVIGVFINTLVEEVMGLRSTIFNLNPRETLVSKPLCEQIDRVAMIAIELRAGNNRLLEGIVSLRETVDQYDAQR